MKRGKANLNDDLKIIKPNSKLDSCSRLFEYREERSAKNLKRENIFAKNGKTYRNRPVRSNRAAIEREASGDSPRRNDGQGAKRNLLGIPGPNFTSSWTRFEAANKRWSTVGAGSEFFSFHLGVDSVRRFWRANECLLERLQVRGGRVPRRLGRTRRIKNRL